MYLLEPKIYIDFELPNLSDFLNLKLMSFMGFLEIQADPLKIHLKNYE